MPVSKITKSAVDKMKPMTVLWDTDVMGFGVRRHHTEGRHYLLRYRFGGKQTFRKIGRAGSPWTPDMARAEALRLLGQIVSGTNPAIAERQGDNFAQELDRYLAQKRSSARPGAFAHIERHLRKQAKPLHPLALADIDRRRIAQVLAQIETASGPVARNRARTSLSAFFSWTVKEGLLDANPVTGTGKADEGPSRDRVLSETELAAVWNALGADDASDIIRLLILSGQRRDEIGKLTFSEIDWDREMIVLGPNRTKNKTKHELPLSPLALSILRKQVRARDLNNDARVFASFSWDYAKQRLDAKLNGVAPWRIHDLRRTCATMMADKLGVLPHIIESVLNHQSGHKAGIVGVYQRAKYEGPMRDALTKWAAFVESITTTST
jgi:integrase